jgi:molybdopterin synthase catalytic subunit
MIDVRLAETSFQPATELAVFTQGLSVEGAIVSFVGRARPESKEGRAVVRLFLDHHPRLTRHSLEEIGQAAATAFEVSAVRIVHRVGEIVPGEAIVFVAAASLHRRAAFEAADYLMDRLKTDALFWKREDGVDGSQWVEPTHADREARERWSKTCPE